MTKTIFITGGARSGKSRFAEELAQRFGAPLGYLATAQTLDDEMAERVGKHRLRRGDAWQTIEEPLHLSRALATCDGTCNAILVDCLTLWLSNLLFHYEEQSDDAEARILEDVHRLTAALREMQTPVIVVSNEVGQGIVPENRLARRFRDIAGQANQILAAMADEVHVVISGIPLRLK
ncbi:bifunctional adenosylcobinamide kinase/adenosylcobinamide-phosphate guanylyltransferase [Geobacter sp. FeAm09]|uniref:bifunctional adenosylcobinamide kinase/adenosylcobinamide-phosphate guanylyltransferase n=1 Tax=Geobacter sp. FeAm09 TaxID=2597769 RepID=UPI0011ED647A|nr:bifunctional adenosylcobinamide kinase/adenosylcobinamide-phosphate guanylyltransferase [Geobacter sp. FeAm09]QEM69224.1 bifunctional adenosylcobinamide kinase/adenosylcobinamide-phosphate guanylyltransferase [Geobacter sp. FeAm09]